MTQIDMIGMVYCEASLWEILYPTCRGGSRTALGPIQP